MSEYSRSIYRSLHLNHFETPRHVPDLIRYSELPSVHDEESRNGRDIKIDILDGYIQTSEGFRVISEKMGVPEGLPETPGD